MPHFKTVTFNNYYRLGLPAIDVKIKVNSKGLFYCSFADEFLPAIQESFDMNWERDFRINHKNEIIITAPTFELMMDRLEKMMDTYSTPDEVRKPVIKYVIDSEIIFAYDDTGAVFPNAEGKQNAQWSCNEKYGHTGRFSSEGGYNLRVGAKAEVKILQQFGGRERTKYEKYDGPDGIDDSPAALLNSWNQAGFDNHVNMKEIPYSDKAALFFHNLLLGMAKLSKMIQEATFDQENLLQLIDKQQNILMIENN